MPFFFIFSFNWCAPAVVILLSAALAAAVQAQPRGSDQGPVQVAAVIEQVRAVPADAGKIAAARDTGFRLLAASRYEDAWAIFSAILEVAPRDERALYGGALALFNLRRLEESERLARAAFESASGPSGATATDSASVRANSRSASDALVLLGVILAVKGDGAAALKAVEQAVTLAPDNFDAQFALGRARYGAGDPAGAARAFRAAVALRSNDAQARFFLATALEGAADYEGALAAYRELLRVRPESAEGHLGLGALLVKIGGEKTDEGIKELAQAIGLNGELYEARITLGRALVRMGRAEQAVEHLERAAALAPDNPEPHYQLAQAYRRLGKRAEAERENGIVKEIHSGRRGKDRREGGGNNDNNSGPPGTSSRDQDRRP
ncbi:MAG TPA: tetratricopeptide repeat protein [Pyrinomonadaceae bacterium]|nr:tetratricopeptide repeat protein [Pyrinomonadaceae bacterium]